MEVNLISVVLPVLNQGTQIEARLLEYLAALDGLNTPFELLPVVTDPHRDNSLDVCHALSRRESRIRTICIDKGGWGGAVQRGLAEARGDLICYTHPARTLPADLHAVLHYGLSHPGSVVKANRRIRDGLIQRLGSLLYVAECRFLFDLPYWDINGTPKVFPRTLSKLLALKSQDELVDLEFDVVCRREGYEVMEVPLSTVGPHNVSGTSNLSSAWRMYIGAYRLWRQIRAHEVSAIGHR